MHKVIGFQITATHPQRINDFYANSFGWEVSAGPHENVYQLNTGTPGIEGSTIGRGDFIPDYVSLFIEAEDLPATLQQCMDHGAELIRPPFELPNGDQLSIIADPEGHVITLVKKADQDTAS